MNDRIIYTGGLGTGKTNAVLKDAEAWQKQTDGWVIGNIGTCPHVERATSLDELEAKVPKHEPSLIVIDDVHAYFLDEQEALKLLELANERGSDLVLSARRMSDVPFSIRRFCTEINVEKADIPETSWDYDPCEVSIWNAEE